MANVIKWQNYLDNYNKVYEILEAYSIMNCNIIPGISYLNYDGGELQVYGILTPIWQLIHMYNKSKS